MGRHFRAEQAVENPIWRLRRTPCPAYSLQPHHRCRINLKTRILIGSFPSASTGEVTTPLTRTVQSCVNLICSLVILEERQSTAYSHHLRASARQDLAFWHVVITLELYTFGKAARDHRERIALERRIRVTMHTCSARIWPLKAVLFWAARICSACCQKACTCTAGMSL